MAQTSSASPCLVTAFCNICYTRIRRCPASQQCSVGGRLRLPAASKRAPFGQRGRRRPEARQTTPPTARASPGTAGAADAAGTAEYAGAAVAAGKLDLVLVGGAPPPPTGAAGKLGPEPCLAPGLALGALPLLYGGGGAPPPPPPPPNGAAGKALCAEAAASRSASTAALLLQAGGTIWLSCLPARGGARCMLSYGSACASRLRQGAPGFSRQPSDGAERHMQDALYCLSDAAAQHASAAEGAPCSYSICASLQQVAVARTWQVVGCSSGGSGATTAPFILGSDMTGGNPTEGVIAA